MSRFSDKERGMGRGRRPGEGWLIAVALILVLALALALWWDRRPQAETVPPVHVVDADALENVALIDVNSASAERLDELPGIGPVLAEAIVAYREEHGLFASLDELDGVRGIGPAKIEEIRPYVRLG